MSTNTEIRHEINRLLEEEHLKVPETGQGFERAMSLILEALKHLQAERDRFKKKYLDIEKFVQYTPPSDP